MIDEVVDRHELIVMLAYRDIEQMVRDTQEGDNAWVHERVQYGFEGMHEWDDDRLLDECVNYGLVDEALERGLVR